MLLDRSRLARACGARRLPAFSDRPAPLAISTVLAAVEHVKAATGATIVPFLFFRRRSAAAHRLGTLPLLGRVGGPAPSAVVTAVADAFLVALALLFAVLVAMWGPLLRQGTTSLVGRLPLVRVVSRVRDHARVVRVAQALILLRLALIAILEDLQQVDGISVVVIIVIIVIVVIVVIIVVVIIVIIVVIVIVVVIVVVVVVVVVVVIVVVVVGVDHVLV